MFGDKRRFWSVLQSRLYVVDSLGDLQLRAVLQHQLREVAGCHPLIHHLPQRRRGVGAADVLSVAAPRVERTARWDPRQAGWQPTDGGKLPALLVQPRYGFKQTLGVRMRRSGVDLEDIGLLHDPAC